MVYYSNDTQGQASPVNLGLPVINSPQMGCLWGAPDPCLPAIKCVAPVMQSVWGERKKILLFQNLNNPLLKQQEIKMPLALQAYRCGLNDVGHLLGEDIWMIDSELSIQTFNHSGNSTLN